MPNPIRVLIVEDQEMVRLGLRLALSKDERIEVVAVAVDGLSGVSAALELRPDVVLMDIGLPDIDGIEAAKRIKKSDEKIHLIMFTSHTDDDSIFTALAAGADGYCCKEASSEELALAIETVSQGAIWLPPTIANRVLRNITNQNGATRKISSRTTELQTREIEILSQIVQGKTGEQIAANLGTEVGTILSEMRDVIDKLGRSDRARTALAAMRHTPGPEEPYEFSCPQCGNQFSGGTEKCKFDGTPLVLNNSDPLIGSVFADRYDILAQIGVGGMSTVYRARHKFMDTDVAIKILAAKLVPDLKSIKRFRQEAQVTSTLTHPNIVTAHDFGITAEGQVFLIMDFIDGQSLASMIGTYGALPVDLAVNIFLQLCEALDYAHRKAIIHRDLKPGNIIITHDEYGEKVKVVDFGIAKLSNNNEAQNMSLTVQGEVFGSPVYMSPEQCTDGPMDERSDIYSLGCLMFECLTGRPPFCGTNSCETIRQQVFERPRAMSEFTDQKIPPALERLVQKCLEKNKEDRFDSAKVVRNELVRCFSNA